MDSNVALPTMDKKIVETKTDEARIPEWKVSGAFSSHMVLQRDKEIKVWGFCRQDGVFVTGEFDNETAHTVVENGRFTLVFGKRCADKTPKSMRIYDDRGNITEFDDILIGDVWLIGGQSNAELNLAPCLSVSRVERFDGDGIYRLFMQTQNYPFTHQQLCDHPQNDVINPDWRWRLPDREASLSFSAIGWFFARDISKSLDMPVGVINVSAGGACIRELVPEELAHRMGYTFGANVREGGFYNTLIHPFIGLAFTGMIFFQGESEGCAREFAERYDTELLQLVEDERSRFGFDFPFYYVQLSDYRAECKQYFPFLETVRIKQLDALYKIKNSSIIPSLDLGSDDDYPDFAHSPKKEALTKRITSLVLAKQYGKGSISDAYCPVPCRAVKSGGRVYIKFANVSGGLVSLGGDRVNGFSVGDYGSATDVEAKITSEDEVTLYLPDNTDADVVNYAYYNRLTRDNAQLYKKGGMPAPAFSIKVSK